MLINSRFQQNLIRCDTLTHENIRSDHIGVSTNLSVCKDDNQGTTKKVWQLNKVNWEEWKRMTENKCGEYLKNTPDDSQTIDKTYQTFTNFIRITQEELIPHKQIKPIKHQKPCLWDNNVTSAKKKHLNYCQKQYWMRNNIPQNKRDL